MSEFIKINNAYIRKSTIQSVQIHDHDSCYFVSISTGKFMPTVNFTNYDDLKKYVDELMLEIDI